MITSVELQDVANVIMGTAPPGESYNTDGEGVPLVAGAGDYGEVFPSPKKWTTTPTRLTKPGDLIVCVRATIGDLNWADREYCIGRGVAALRPIEGKLDSRYLAHYINSQKRQLTGLGTGSTFLAIRRSDIETFPIPLPKLEEQKRIAAILDKADAIRRQQVVRAKTASDLPSAVFHRMFGCPGINAKGWDNCELSKLVADADKVNYGVVQPGLEIEDGVPLVRVSDLVDGYVDTRNLKRIATDIDARHKKSKLKGTEVLLVCVGVTIGKVALADEKIEGANIARALARIPCGPKLLPEFLAEYLRTPSVQSTLVSETRTVAQPTLNIRQIEELRVFLPPIELQQQYADFVNRFSRVRDFVADAGKHADFLFNSLVQRAFKGEL